MMVPAQHREKMRPRRRIKSYVPEALVLLALGTGLPWLWVFHVRAASDISFDRLAALSVDEAMAEIRSHGGPMQIRFDGEPTRAQGFGIRPKTGAGLAPRFFNIGDEPGAIYQGESGAWYVLGRFKVLEYANGEWYELGIINNQRYVYRPRNGD